MKEYTYDFSIIVPVHNNEDTIVNCVNSLLKQDCSLQVILVENNSNDDSLMLCQELSSNYSNIDLIISKDIGVSSARNHGIKRALGRYIGFCDADDYYLQNSLEFVLSKFNQSDYDMIVTGFEQINNGNVEERVLKKEKVVSSTALIEYISCYPLIMGSVWNKFYKKSIICNMHFNTDLTHLEDSFFNYELLVSNRTIKCLITNRMTYAYVKNDNSVTCDYTRKYNKNNELVNIQSLEYALSQLSFDAKEVTYIKDQEFRIAVINLWNGTFPNETAKVKLLQTAKKYYKFFVKHKFINDASNRKRILVKYLLLRMKYGIATS